MKKRQIEIAIISDVHLGTYGCHAEELLAYLSSIKPKTLILNGDIIDVWRFDKRYFPPSHFKVLRKILSMASNGTEVHYICGNHDEIMRKFNNLSMGNFHVRNKLLLELDGKKAWIFHGDAFDLSIRKTRWIARTGSRGYALLLRLNRGVNTLLSRMGRDKISLAQRIRDGVANSRQYIEDFERTVSDLAIHNECDYVICGHIHHPKKQWIEKGPRKSLYLNSGDWVDNLTALEYNFKRWKLYWYKEDKLSPFFADEDLKEMDIDDLISSIVDRGESGQEKQREKEKEKPSEE